MKKWRAAAVLALLALACGQREPTTWTVRGVVRDVSPDGRQVLVEHEEIPDLMPAMTMNFELAAPAASAALQPGQEVEFTLEYADDGFRILQITPLGASRTGASGPGFGALLVPDAPAPDFVLIDQAGESLALRELRGKAVLLDFIFTSCPGPCPIQTATHVRLQGALEAALREKTHFVSISIDPQRDTPEALRAYARRLGVDLSGWSFVTGTVEEVDVVLERYGIRKIPADAGNVDHILATYLIDPKGRVTRRYLGSSRGVDEMVEDIRDALASVPHAGAGHIAPILLARGLARP